jgi:hypothetical protein
MLTTVCQIAISETGVDRMLQDNLELKVPECRILSSVIHHDLSELMTATVIISPLLTIHACG